MILKKPYAFLIKRFRLIHFILAALTVYICIATNQIVDVFRNFIKNGYTISIVDNMASMYVGTLVYLAIIVVIAAFVLIVILLKNKKKPVKFYIVAIAYYAILFIFIVIAAYLIGGLSKHLWSAAEARTYRDFGQIIYYTQFAFIVVLAIRALGFNVKQFNFKNDLKEMEVTDSDSEEIEVNINFETYKAERKIRRFARELKYYYLENKFLIRVFAVVLVLFLGYSAITSYEKVKYTYRQNQSFTMDNFTVKVTDSIISDVDLGGNTIYEDKIYVVVRMEVTNNRSSNGYLSYDNLKLYYGFKYVYPSLDLGLYFLDFGTPYMGGPIGPKETKTIVIPYMIDKKYINRSFKISAYTGLAVKTDIFKPKNAIIKLKPKKYMGVDVVSESSLNSTMLFNNTLLNDSSLNIRDAKIDSKYEYKYRECYKDDCHTYTDIVYADRTYLNKEALIIMDYELGLDSSAPFYTNINNIRKFADSFMSVEYTKYGKTFKTTANNVTPTRLNDKLIIQTDGDIMSADKVDLLVTVRNKCYIINIK